MAKKCMLTTIDNPFDPFEQFTSWLLFDEEKGYHSCSYLGRIARTSDQLSDEENDLEVERAIDEIAKYDFRNIYKKLREMRWLSRVSDGIGGAAKSHPSVIAAVLKIPRGYFSENVFTFRQYLTELIRLAK